MIGFFVVVVEVVPGKNVNGGRVTIGFLLVVVVVVEVVISTQFSPSPSYPSSHSQV